MSFVVRHLALIARACPAALLALLILTGAGHATERATFDVRIAGLRVGYVAYAAVNDGNRYSASSEVRSTGLAASVRPFRFESRVQGRIAGGRYRPSTYQENADTGTRQSQVEITYAQGVPRIVNARNDQTNPNVTPADPATQRGALDPMTVTYALLRDRPDDARACRMDINMFDGVRASRLVLRPSSEPLVCDGVYTRVSGFSPADMVERTNFPMKITLGEASAGGLEVKRVALQTLLGPATLERR